MKKIICVLCCLIGLSSAAQDNSFVQHIQEKLTNHFKQFPSENIFVQTDRDLYRAGDVVWFSTFVRNPALNSMGSVSDYLMVALYDESAELVNEDKYQMINGLCHGDFDLPADLKAGRYVLAAYNGSSRNANEAFLKILYVDDFRSNSLLVTAETDQKLLIPGQSNELLFTVTEMDGKPYKGKLSYELFNGAELLHEGKIKPEEAGRLKLNVDLSKRDFKQPLQLVLSDGHWPVYRSYYHVQSEQVQVSLHAEGANLLAGTNQKVAFTAVNSLGQPVQVEGLVMESGSNEQLTHFKTLAAGFGIFHMTAEAGKHYHVVITDGPGKGQEFDIPEVKPAGLVLSLNRTEDDFICMSLTVEGLDSQQLSLVAFRSDQVFWATELQVDESVNIKIPKDDFSQGLCNLVVFNSNMEPLSNRLVFVKKNGLIGLQSSLEAESRELKLALEARDGVERSAVAAISLCPSVLISDDTPIFESQMLSGCLDEPVWGLRDLLVQGKLTESILNSLLVGNNFRNASWADIEASQAGERQAEGIVQARVEKQLPTQVELFLQQHAFDHKPAFTADFFRHNSDLFKRVKAATEAHGVNYQNLLQSGSSLLDVIKMIKPYNLQGDKIVFPGGSNSLVNQDGALIVLDGQRLGTSATVLNTINPYDVETIRVSTNPMDIQQYTGLNSVGLIDITTKKGLKPEDQTADAEKEYNNGYRVPRHFDKLSDKSRLTAYWQPVQLLNGSLQLELPKPDLKGQYLLQIGLVDEKGYIGSKQLSFEEE